MTVITARRYLHGRPSDHALTINGSPRTPLELGAFDWIGLCEPDEDEMDRLAAQFGLHPLAVEDALNPRQLPKAEAYGKQLFIVARTAELTATEVIDYGQTAIFLGADFIITVRFGSTRAHNDLRRDLEKNPTAWPKGPITSSTPFSISSSMVTFRSWTGSTMLRWKWRKRRSTPSPNKGRSAASSACGASCGGLNG